MSSVMQLHAVTSLGYIASVTTSESLQVLLILIVYALSSLTWPSPFTNQVTTLYFLPYTALP